MSSLHAGQRNSAQLHRASTSSMVPLPPLIGYPFMDSIAEVVGLRRRGSSGESSMARFVPED